MMDAKDEGNERKFAIIEGQTIEEFIERNIESLSAKIMEYAVDEFIKGESGKAVIAEHTSVNK